MQGQAHHFVRYAPEKIEYGIKRYTNETRRLYQVLDKHFSEGRKWVAAGQSSIADIANFAWVYEHAWAGMTTTPLHGPKSMHGYEHCTFAWAYEHALRR